MASNTSTRTGRGGKVFTYLQGCFIIDQLNETFGPLGWSTSLQVDRIDGPFEIGDKIHWQAIVTLTLTIPLEEITKVSTDVGYGNGTGWDGLELALKEARTDALKRAAKDLGPGFGLGLYDKDNPLHKGGIDAWGRLPKGHHPEWEPNRRWFMAQLASMDLKYEDVKGWLLHHTGKKPSAGGRTSLENLLLRLGTQKGRESINQWKSETKETP